jgi:RNA polymerase sigma-70 factor (ECF subfamily)
MDDLDWLAERFAEHRPRLRAAAYRLLGSLPEVEDAIQDAWLRASGSRTRPREIDNPGAWLTTIVARVCLNMLRSRRTRNEEPWDLFQLPDPVLGADGRMTPEDEALLSDRVGLALQIVLDELGPDERLAFVLHDLFALPFGEIAAVLERPEPSVRQLASRGRRRVSEAGALPPEPDLVKQREVIAAFFAAAREGDFDALVAVLHPDVVARADFGGRRLPTPAVVRGAAKVAENARLGYVPAARQRPVLVNGAAAAIIVRGERPVTLMAFTVSQGRITELNIYGDHERVARLAGALLL